jgi:hypothetical protein
MGNSYIENPNGGHMLWWPLYIQKFFSLKNTKISIFGGISKFLKLIVFEQILAGFGSFRLFWTDFVALAVADNMPKFWLKS